MVLKSSANLLVLLKRISERFAEAEIEYKEKGDESGLHISFSINRMPFLSSVGRRTIACLFFIDAFPGTLEIWDATR